MKLDILAVGVHPDDVELAAAGTIMKHIDLGYKVGILDLTEGQLGSRGSGDIRLQEARDAGEVMGLDVRVNLGMDDGWFRNDKESKLAIIRQLRHFKPDIVLCNAIRDRHPDHGRASNLVSEACFYSGLVKIETEWEGSVQEQWRPKAVYHYIQDREIKPDFVVDISKYIDRKIEAIMCFKTQFYNPDSKEPNTPISSKAFLDLVSAKGRIYGRDISTDYAEAFTIERNMGIEDLTKLI